MTKQESNFISEEDWKQIYFDWKYNPTKETNETLYKTINEAVKADFATIKRQKHLVYTQNLDDKIKNATTYVYSRIIKLDYPINNIVNFAYWPCFKEMFDKKVIREEEEISLEDYMENGQDVCNEETKLVGMVSGFYDPLTSGHLQEMAFAKEHCDKLICIVMSDRLSAKKSGTYFMPMQDKLAILYSLKWIDEVHILDSKDGTIIEALEKYKPDILFKSADRSVHSELPEYEFCNDNGIEIMSSSSEKIQSSSNILKEYRERFSKCVSKI